MQVTIKSIQLLNFKGIRNLKFDFGKITNISGDNGTGKSTVFDAFTWLLFGKNSNDDKDFNIKTLDEHNNPIHRLEHIVSAQIEIDGKVIDFKRVYKEKWVKKKGEEVQEFSGHETLFFVDDVPLSQTEYKSRVDFILNESIAKMITSPTYFNSLKWQERRKVLETMAGSITNEEVAGSNQSFKDLLVLIGGEDLDKYKKKISAKKALLKESLSKIPTRIDEAKLSMPEAADYTQIEKRIEELNLEIKEVEGKLEDKTKAFETEYQAIQNKQSELHQLKMKLSDAEGRNKYSKQEQLTDIGEQIRLAENSISTAKGSQTSNENQIKAWQAEIDRLIQANNILRDDWTKENARTLEIDVNSFNCPTCKQSLPESEIELKRSQFTENFNNDKKGKLDRINATGATNKAEIEKLKQKIKDLEEFNVSLATSVNESEAILSSLKQSKVEVENSPVVDTEEIVSLRKEIEGFIIPGTPIVDNAELKSKRQDLQNELLRQRSSLSTRDQRQKIESRIKDLEQEEQTQSQELASLEREEFTIAEFSKAKIETIESRINGKFNIVKFKMFESQINGGESETCECLVNGVPYSDVNTAGKIQAGIDIINALSKHNNINAPIFIDNRESIVRIPDCDSQIINLIVKVGSPLEATIIQ